MALESNGFVQFLYVSPLHISENFFVLSKSAPEDLVLLS